MVVHIFYGLWYCSQMENNIHSDYEDLGNLAVGAASAARIDATQRRREP